MQTASPTSTAHATRGERIKDLLYEISDLPDQEQQQRIQHIARTNAAEAAELQSLLAHLGRTAPGLHAPERLAQAMQAAELPERLGPWKVEGELGRGGMGVVLRGRRDDGAFDKPVAIKVLPPFLGARDRTKQFVQEARLLASLDHPHIARLIDAGTAHGCAYFVMDLVEGQPITTHAQHAPVSTRLGLFLDLCSAVSFAHSRLLIHRDLKPANVLVDGQGSVKLLDFGIAKLVDQGGHGTQDVAPTLVQQAMTPAYASPEQLRGAPVSVQSDVYALGILLYELCVGSHPLVESATTTHKTQHVLQAMLHHQVKRAPMQRARLPKDLQAIILKAIDVDPTRRYGSVDAMAADVEALLSGQPVKAQAPSWHYLLSKFVRRNWLFVSAGTAIGCTVVGLSAWALHSAQVAREQTSLAERRLAAVRSIANRVVFDYNKALAPIGGTLEVRRLLVADALSYLQAQVTEAGSDWTLLSEVARGLEAVGQVQGQGLMSGSLGDWDGARRTYEQAEALRARVCENAPNLRVASLEFGPLLPSCSAHAVTLLTQGDNHYSRRQMQLAQETTQRAYTLNERVLSGLASTDPTREAVTMLQAQLSHRLGWTAMRLSGADFERGLQFGHSNLPKMRQFAKQYATNHVLILLRDALELSTAQAQATGRWVEYQSLANEALAVARRYVGTRTDGDVGLVLVASILRAAEAAVHNVHVSEANARVDEAYGLIRKFHGADPTNRLLRMRFVNMTARAARVLLAMEQPHAIETVESMLSDAWPVAAEFKPEDGVSWIQAQKLIHVQARVALAKGQPRLAYELLRALPPLPDSEDRLTRWERLDADFMHAQAAQQVGLHSEAQAVLKRIATTRAQRAVDTPLDVQNRAELLQICHWATRTYRDRHTQELDQACSTADEAALREQGLLSPWWLKQLNSQ